MIEFLLLLLAIGIPWSSNAQVNEINNPPQPSNIIILAGQSNMAGRGGVVDGVWDGIVPPECQPNPSILRLSANLTWEEAKEPLHKDIDVNKTNGVGPGMSFANYVLSRYPGLGCIGLVPCAIGGTNISQWERGTFLYNQLINRANAAVKGGGSIRAILWYQGESDTIVYEDSISYKKNLKRFLSHVRADLGSPLLPVIQVALASGEGPFIDIVRQAQLGIKRPNVRCVDAKGLKVQPPDDLHLTTQSQVKLGQMLADAFFQFLPHPLPIDISNNILMALIEVLLLLLAMANPLQANAPQPSNMFILAGQSNMAGRGGVLQGVWDGIVPPKCQLHPSIFRLNAKLAWEPAKEPIHKDIDVTKTNGIGPGMAFANTVLHRDPGFGTIGLVPCTVGDEMDAKSYKTNLKRFFTDVRKDLRLPLIPIIQLPKKPAAQASETITGPVQLRKKAWKQKQLPVDQAQQQGLKQHHCARKTVDHASVEVVASRQDTQRVHSSDLLNGWGAHSDCKAAEIDQEQKGWNHAGPEKTSQPK
ncbi:OLC1v1016865C1 [Oldenlandia corymbosa var. corymbosa]|uniref:OLC1v1016865C1 n=1 Tax=Oldenlandia corymbosa var. corymbosa TaxID=529605 RepID=A0AAV1E849_OLDCO|nr:OLC1v1016865C1 [Oldenlandia corymbosa var. corymbosa]